VKQRPALLIDEELSKILSVPGTAFAAGEMGRRKDAEGGTARRLSEAGG
jgi:hypothetical protein